MSAIPSGGPNHSQFVLGPGWAERENWITRELGDSLRLSVHPDLPLHCVEHGGLRLTLLGIILDWAHPERSDVEILRQLAQAGPGIAECRSATSELGGRWVLICQDGRETCVFHDASGLRQVCFAAADAIWCASQPSLLAELAGLEPDQEALDFMAVHSQNSPNYWWPGDRLPFLGARALLPNHALDMATGQVARYWPEQQPSRMSAEEIVEAVGSRLRGTILAGVERFDMSLGLSAGWDSRILLGASQPVQNRISIYNAQGADMPETHRDVAIPRRLVQRLGLQLDTISEPTEADPEFASFFAAHAWNVHPVFITGMQGDFAYAQRKKVAVIGNVSEIGKLPYRNKSQAGEIIDARHLAGLYWGGHEYAVRAIDEWLTALGDASGYDVLDMFYWEQRLGRWLAENCVEFDVAWKDILAPFNMRRLMVDLLASDEALRRPPQHELYRRLIESLWPEVLLEPINPVPKRSLPQRVMAILRRSREALRRLGIG